MIVKYKDPQTGYEESVAHAGLWCLLFGSIYFAVKGVWTHAVVSLVLACLTCTISWFIYPLFARGILEKHYRKQGWLPVDEHGRTTSAFRQCPHCAETIRAEARLCKHCKTDVSEDAEISSGWTTPAASINVQGAATGQGGSRSDAGVKLTVGVVALLTAAVGTLAFQAMTGADGAGPGTVGGLAIVILVLSLGCWLRRQKFGLVELGVVCAWFAVASVMSLAPTKYTLQPTNLTSRATLR